VGAGEQGLELGDELVDLVLGDVATRRRPSARHPRSLARRRRTSPPAAGTNDDEHYAQDRAKLENEATACMCVCPPARGSIAGSLWSCGNWERRCVGYPGALDWGSLCKLKLDEAGVSN
jgi:hypothetical protein